MIFAEIRRKGADFFCFFFNIFCFCFIFFPTKGQKIFVFSKMPPHWGVYLLILLKSFVFLVYIFSQKWCKLPKRVFPVKPFYKMFVKNTVDAGEKTSYDDS